MLSLPIRQRERASTAAGDPSDARLGGAGRDLVLGAFEMFSSSPGDDSHEGRTISVKNTFIDIEDDEEKPQVTLHSKGAQTALARFSEPVSSFGELDLPQKNHSLPERPAEPVATPTPHPDSQNVQFQMPIIQQQVQQQQVQQQFGWQQHQQQFPQQLPVLPVQQPMQQPMQQPIQLRNQQVMFQQYQMPRGDGSSSGSPVSPCSIPPPPVTPPSMQLSMAEEEPPPPQVSPANFGRILLGSAFKEDIAPSAGSVLHGNFDDEGMPACQPCAWFYKPSGCVNAEACKRCHLCPEGEPKLRKKQKVARLRAQQAEAEAHHGPPQEQNGQAVRLLAAPQLPWQVPQVQMPVQCVQYMVPAPVGAAFTAPAGAAFTAPAGAAFTAPAGAPAGVAFIAAPYSAPAGNSLQVPGKLNELGSPISERKNSSPRWADIGEDEL